MNKRIQELAEQAESTITWGSPYNYDHYTQAFDEWQDKFAELVIKETMRVVASNLPSNTYLDVADAVIQHFKG